MFYTTTAQLIKLHRIDLHFKGETNIHYKMYKEHTMHAGWNTS